MRESFELDEEVPLPRSPLPLKRVLASLDIGLEEAREELRRRQATLERLQAQMERLLGHGNEYVAAADDATEEAPPSSPGMKLADAMEDRGDVLTACLIARDVVERRRKVFGDRDLRTLAAIRKLGSLLHDAGDVASAEPLYSEVWHARRAVLGEHHQLTISSMVDLAMARRDQVMCTACSNVPPVRAHPHTCIRGRPGAGAA